jgi:hypothetical protein
MLWFCLLVSTLLSALCPFKDHVALASLPFINGMSVPSCVVAPVRASCTYAAVFLNYVIIFMLGALFFGIECARRLSLSDQHAAIPRLDRRPAECFLTEDFYQDASNSRRRVG